MIDEADLDHDGEINEQEFLRIMKKTMTVSITSQIIPIITTMIFLNILMSLMIQLVIYKVYQRRKK
jgi:hypothetical protein